MRIFNFYDDYRRVGRNDGAPMYATRVLREMGHDVLHLVPDAKLLEGVGRADLYLWIDWGEDALKGVLDYEPIRCPTDAPSVYWTSDTHLGFDYRLAKAREFSNVFCMQKQAAEDFRANGVASAQWLPHAFEPLAYPKHTMVKDYDVCFVGHLNSMNRIDFLDRMFKEFPNFWFGRRIFEQAAEIYCRSKIVLNPPIKHEANMRLWESLGCGSFCLTENFPSIKELFKDGVHLVTYENEKDAIEKAKYYLEHDAEREKIAEAGYNWVKQTGTYKHRMTEILKKTGLEIGANEINEHGCESWRLPVSEAVDVLKRVEIAS